MKESIRDFNQRVLECPPQSGAHSAENEDLAAWIQAGRIPPNQDHPPEETMPRD